MKIKCISKTGQSIIQYTRKITPIKKGEYTEFGCSLDTEYDELFIGKEYLVMGLILRGGYLHYLIDEDGRIAFYPYPLFEITDNRMPKNWNFNAFEIDNDIYINVEAVWGYYELCFEQDHFEKLIDMEKTAQQIYFMRKIEMEQEL